MSEEQHAQVIALGKQPISDDRPVGDPVRYETEFEQLQAEIDKLGSLAGEQPDWRSVTELATEILKNKSKDLLVMSYLVLGLFEQDGYAGLRAAITCYNEFLNTFWESCFPKIKPPHGRYNAIQYLADRLTPMVEQNDGPMSKKPGANEKEAVHKAADEFATLDETVEKVFTGQPDTPNLIPLKKALRALKEKVGPLEAPAAAAPAGEAAPAPAESAPAAASAAPTGGGLGAAPESFTSTTQAVQSILRVAKFLLSQNPNDPRAYRLMRAVHFGGLAQPPKDRLIPAPPAPRRQFFENAAASGNWPQLMTEAEGQFATTPLWLDMQRYVAIAAKNQGPMLEAIHDAVVLETASLQRRMPELFDLSFKDGTPFADGATKAWLEESAGAIGGGGAGGGGGGDDPVAKAVSEARKLITSAKAADAIDLLYTQVGASGTGRARFRAQLALASLCLDLNKPQLACSILEGLEGQVDDFHLEEWEPALAADVMRDLYAGMKKLKPKPTPDDLKRQSDVFARLCRLDPAAAFKLDGDGKK